MRKLLSLWLVLLCASAFGPAFGQVTTSSSVNLTSSGSGIAGTTTNNDAAAGIVGEYVSASVTGSPGVSLSTGTSASVTSISLTAGDWDVTGVLDFNAAATTNVTSLDAGASSTNNTLGGEFTRSSNFGTPSAGYVPGTNLVRHVIPVQRFSLSSTTTIYCVGRAFFTVSTLTAGCEIRARRVR